MKKDISNEIVLLNDVLSILTATNGMQDCDANWISLSDLAEKDFNKHKGLPTEDFASDVFAGLLKHISNHLTVPEGDGKEVIQ